MKCKGNYADGGVNDRGKGMVESEEREALAAASSELALQFRKLSTPTSSIPSSRFIISHWEDCRTAMHFYHTSMDFLRDAMLRSDDFVKNTKLFKSMQSDLNYIFLNLRNMKGKLQATYPDAFPDSSAARMIDQRPLR